MAKFRRLNHGYSLPLHNINSCLMQYTFMLPLEVVGPGGSLSMLLSPRLNGEMPAESSLAGGNGDVGIQLRPDDGGASSSAGVGSGSVAVAAFSLRWIPNFVIRIRIIHIRPLTSLTFGHLIDYFIVIGR